MPQPMASSRRGRAGSLPVLVSSPPSIEPAAPSSSVPALPRQACADRNRKHVRRERRSGETELMDFDLNDEQRQLKDSLERLLAANYGDLNKRLAYMKEPKGYSAALWKQYADLGLLAVPFAEEHGGLGQGLTETMIIAEAFGRALAIEPYLATVVLAGGALRHSGNSEQLSALVPAIVEGKLTLALAHQERQARYDIADTATTARADGRGGFTLEGEKTVVLHGDCADKLIVTARASGGRADRSGIGLFVIDGKASGVTRRGYPTQDG